MGELRWAEAVKDVVVEVRLVRPAIPIRKKHHVCAAIRAGIDRVVVNERVFDRTCDRYAASAVVLADVVADDGPGVAGALGGWVSAFVANEKESAVVVMAVVVLNYRVAAVPIGVEALP